MTLPTHDEFVNCKLSIEELRRLLPEVSGPAWNTALSRG